MEKEKNNNNNDKLKAKKRSLARQKKTESVIPSVGDEGGWGEQAEMHGVIYTPPGTELLLRRPQIKAEGIGHPGIQAPFLWVREEQAGWPLYRTHPPRLRGWQTGRVC